MSFRTEKQHKSGKSGSATAILFIITLLAIGAFFWAFLSYQKAKEQIAFLGTREGQLQLNQQDVEELLTQVRKHMLLPEGVQPTIALVNDAAALSQTQPFFANAEDGDRVLIYQDRAILFSPGRDLIVNVGPVQIEGAAPVAQPAPQRRVPPRVEEPVETENTETDNEEDNQEDL